MLSFSLVAEALTGLIYHRPSGENSKFLPYKDFVKILLTVHKRVYDMKHKMDIWFFQEEKNMKNISTKNTKVSA